MVNTQLLDEKIEKSGLKIGFIVDKLGISWNGFNKKRTGKTPFRAAEIYVIGDLLSLNDAEKDEIFFADKVES
jgi:hypothetical protein